MGPASLGRHLRNPPAGRSNHAAVDTGDTCVSFAFDRFALGPHDNTASLALKCPQAPSGATGKASMVTQTGDSPGEWWPPGVGVGDGAPGVPVKQQGHRTGWKAPCVWDARKGAPK